MGDQGKAALMFFYDRLGDKQSQPGPPLFLFAGDKGFENSAKISILQGAPS